jgi:hypothetical protein
LDLLTVCDRPAITEVDKVAVVSAEGQQLNNRYVEARLTLPTLLGHP